MDPALQEEILPTLNANEFIEAMVRLKNPDQIPAGINVVARFGDIFTCRVQRGLVNQVYNHPNVRSFKAARVFSHSHFLPDQFQDFTEVPENNYMSFDASDSVTESSEVIIGILDWGCDFAHHDFINPDGTSRIIALWDQSKSISGKIPQPYNYGSVHSHADINRAISTAQPYHMLQYHPSIADNGHGAHGTHVMGIAAANGRSGTQGVCPNAKIIFVHLATIDTAGNYNLGDSVRLLEALDFVKRTAGDRPCVINLSVGKHGGPHDGTTLVEQAMDNMLDPSRNFAICQSAGNYFNDNIHAGGFIKPLTTHQIDFYIDRADTTQNELEVWYNSKDKFVFKIVTPGNVTAECIINSSREVILNNTVIGRMYHRSNEPNNGKNHFEIFLYTNAPPGEWKLLITPVKLLDGRFDAWIERDNACDTCQSRFLLTSNSTLATTNTICNGYNTIVTGAYNSRVQPFALTTFSSSGPTIDGRIRPLLIAPGHQISSSKSSPRGSNTGSNAVTLMSGTSMASPRVAGTVALILSKFGQRPQPFFVIRDILLSSCTEVNLPPHFHRVGYGLLNQQNAINKANEILRLAIVNSNSSGDNKESLKLNLKSTPQLQLPTSHTCSCQKHNQDNTIPFLEMMDSGPVPSFENVSLEQLDAATGTIKNAINRLVPSFHDTTFYNTSSAAITYSPLEQFTLNNLISNTRKYNSAKKYFSVALTIFKSPGLSASLFKPLYAGHNDLENYYAASTSKIAGLYAAYQLKANLNLILQNTSIQTVSDLQDSIYKTWSGKGFAQSKLPKITEVFDIDAQKNLVFKPQLISIFDNLSHGNENGSTPIILCGLHFIGSCMLDSGLLNSIKGGVSVRRSYGDITYNLKKFRQVEFHDSPFNKFASHNVNAISTNLFFSLLAQGRLISKPDSQAMLNHLDINKGGCITNQMPKLLEALTWRGGFVAAKCGIFTEYLHVPFYYKDDALEFCLCILTENDKANLIDELASDIFSKIILPSPLGTEQVFSTDLIETECSSTQFYV